MAKPFPAKLIAANRLDTGRIAYLTPRMTWSDDACDALVINDATQLDEITQFSATQMHLITGIEPIDLDSKQLAVRLRDRIRQNGPTIHPQFGAQAAPAPRQELADVSL